MEEKTFPDVFKSIEIQLVLRAGEYINLNCLILILNIHEMPFLSQQRLASYNFLSVPEETMKEGWQYIAKKVRLHHWKKSLLKLKIDL